MKIYFHALVVVDTTRSTISIEHDEPNRSPDRGRIVLIPPRKGQAVHVVHNDLPLALAGTAKQLVRKVIDSLILPSDLTAKTPGAQNVERDIKQDLQSIMRREG